MRACSMHSTHKWDGRPTLAVMRLFGILDECQWCRKRFHNMSFPFSCAILLIWCNYTWAIRLHYTSKGTLLVSLFSRMPQRAGLLQYILTCDCVATKTEMHTRTHTHVVCFWKFQYESSTKKENIFEMRSCECRWRQRDGVFLHFVAISLFDIA